MNNTVQKIMVSAEISKKMVQDNGIKTIDDLQSFLVSDSFPQIYVPYRYSNEYEKNIAEANADIMANDYASAGWHSGGWGGRGFAYVSCTCLEYYEADEDGGFVDGCDYDNFAEFDDKSKAILREHLGIEI